MNHIFPALSRSPCTAGGPFLEKCSEGCAMQIYGPDASPEAILSGQISAPPEFQPLYDLINKLASEAVEEMEDPSADAEV